MKIEIILDKKAIGEAILNSVLFELATKEDLNKCLERITLKVRDIKVEEGSKQILTIGV